MADDEHRHPVDPERVAQARARVLSAEDSLAITTILNVVSDPTRLRVLHALDVVDEMCVGDIALALEVSEDSASYALRLLRTAGLVAQRKQGRVVYYRLARDLPEPLRPQHLSQIIDP